MSTPFTVRNSRAVIPYKDRQVSADIFVANSQHKVTGQHIKGEPSKPCTFCQGTHFNDYIYVVINISRLPVERIN